MTDTLLGFGQNGESDDITPDIEAQKQYILGNPNLPIANYRSVIEQSAADNVVTIMEGDTGSGKTTQVGQYLYEMGLSGFLDISQFVLTQPRVVATVTIADRYFEEMQQGGIKDPKVGPYTQPHSSPIPQSLQDIVVATSGKISAQMSHQTYEPSEKLTFLAVDEVHEKGIAEEVVLAIAHDRIDKSSKEYDKNLRLLVMSATLDVDALKNYFSHTTVGHIKVESKPFAVEASESDESVAKTALGLVQKGKTVLVFQAGKGEIDTTLEKIEGIQAFQDPSERAAVVTLHAQQNSQQQSEAFTVPENGQIVLATNVAQTSLTLPHVVAVVDTGEERVSAESYQYVPTGHKTLNVQNISQSDVIQRAGRAGRTEPGQSVRVRQTSGMPVKFESLPKYSVPAMFRESLADITLKAKAVGKDLSDYTYLHEPPEQAVEAAKLKLRMLGAFDKDGTITDRGRRMEELPLDPEYACMIAYAEEQGYSDQVKQNLLDIVAIMQRGGIFDRSPKKQKWVDLLAFDENGEVAEKQSDLLAQLEGYATLVQDIPQQHWEEFDINMYAVEIITARREKLANDIGLPTALPVSSVKPEDREAVLACIYAGQLPQVWRRNGEAWQLAYSPKAEFELHPSSVVSQLGKIATGSLFSLGVHGQFSHSIQDVSIVDHLGVLDKVADHLVEEVVVPNSRRFDAKNGVYTDDYERKLGVITLRTITREVTAESEKNAADRLAKDYSELIWRQHNSTPPLLEAYMPEDIEQLKDNPEYSVIGTNIYSGEPIYEWYGADRRPMRTEEDARKSLNALMVRTENEPIEQQRRIAKEEIVANRPKLIEISRGRGDIAVKAKKLLRQKGDALDRIKQINEFLDSIT